MAYQGSASDPSSSTFFGTQRGPFFLALGGMAFIYGAIAVFAVVCYKLFREAGATSTVVTLNAYLAELILIGIGVFGAVLGVILLRSVGLASSEPNRVINEVEWSSLEPKVKGGDEKAIDQYIRLTSLRGFTGAFTKLGLTGLPLATIGLTLIFSALSIGYPDFMDLAKLTLGAFIGSFVQRQGSITLPTGERVPTRSTSAPPV